jgi:hypothetical protein
MACSCFWIVIENNEFHLERKSRFSNTIGKYGNFEFDIFELSTRKIIDIKPQARKMQ